MKTRTIVALALAVVGGIVIWRVLRRPVPELPGAEVQESYFPQFSQSIVERLQREAKGEVV
ncbi:MAG: hypothetical protein ACYTG0_12665 [Planctomycetota bacterium]|jgi:hypothetical protein